MEWSDVKVGLLQLLGESITAWLETLTESNGGHQLAICLQIDLHFKRIPLADVRGILSRINIHAVDPAGEFGKQVENWELENDRSPYYNRLHNGGSHEPCSYARLLEIGEFIRYYASPKTGFTMSAVARRRVRRIFFSKPNGTPLAKVKEPWHGGRKRTWVLPGSEIDPVLATKRRDPTALVDRLGLAMKEGIGEMPHIVCVRYPDGEPLKAAQPTTFDANWTRGRTFFLSHCGLKGWGLTHGLSGQYGGCLELVHGPIRLTNAHLGLDVGQFKPIQVREELVMKEAYTRLEQIANNGSLHPLSS